MTRCILLVDDNSDIVDVYVDLMNVLGYCDVVTAKNGEDAIAKYQSHNPALVIMDVNMPKMDGVAAFRKIMDLDNSANIMFLTANPDCKELVDLQKEYQVDVLSKTNSISYLGDILKKNLG